MAVLRSCDTDAGAVILRASGGEYLEYGVPRASEGVEYQVVDGSGAKILANTDGPPPCVRRWPARGAGAPTGTTVHHTLGIQFFDDQSLTYEVDHKRGDDTLVARLKRCTYANRGEPDDFFDPLEVLVR